MTQARQAASIKKAAVIAGMLFVATGYPACYVVARVNHVIVHRSAHTYDAHGHQVPSLHEVEAGDGKLASPNPLIAAFFTPLRLIEKAAWHLIAPLGKPDGLP